MTKDIRNSYTQFYYTVLSAVRVSNECSHSSSGAQHNMLYYTVWYSRYNRAGESI